MRTPVRLMMASVVAAGLTVDTASAGDCCWSGAYYPAVPAYYAQPAYPYVRATGAVYPAYVVRQTYVVPETVYVVQRPISNAYLVNQGQLYSEESTIPIQLYDGVYLYAVRSTYRRPY